MSIKKRFNKKANIAVTMLVLMTLVLAGATLFIFNINKGKIETNIGDYSYLNMIYLKENQMDFYINDILDEVVKDFDVSEGKDRFIEKFNIELEKYKQTDGTYAVKELEKVKEQADKADSFVFDSENKKIILNLDIRIDEKPSENINIAYAYKKTFEKDL